MNYVTRVRKRLPTTCSNDRTHIHVKNFSFLVTGVSRFSIPFARTSTSSPVTPQPIKTRVCMLWMHCDNCRKPSLVISFLVRSKLFIWKRLQALLKHWSKIAFPTKHTFLFQTFQTGQLHKGVLFFELFIRWCRLPSEFAKRCERYRWSTQPGFLLVRKWRSSLMLGKFRRPSVSIPQTRCYSRISVLRQTAD